MRCKGTESQSDWVTDDVAYGKVRTETEVSDHFCGCKFILPLEADMNLPRPRLSLQSLYVNFLFLSYLCMALLEACGKWDATP